MASVYYLIDDAIHIADDIVHKYSQQDTNLKENHYAATIIQRTYRGYVTRKLYKKHLQAIVILQKYVRGWLVRYHLPDRLQEFWDSLCQNTYQKAALKIQATWKGFMVRREIDIKKIMAEKKKAEQITKEFHDDSSDLNFESTKEDREVAGTGTAEELPIGGTPLGKSKDQIRRILELMFDRHHLLSTQIHQGVLKSSRELQEIEKVLKTLPWKDYMKKMRKLYFKYQKPEHSRKCLHIFADKRMQYQEDLLKLRDTRGDIKDIDMRKCIADNRPPFNNMCSKFEETSYQKSLLYEGKYIKPETNIKRTEDKSKNISDKDFAFALKKIVTECNIPPYYADFWYQECIGHHFVE